VLRTNQQRSLRQTAEFLEVEDQVVFAATCVLEDIAFAKGRRNWRVDAPGDSETEVSYLARKRNPRFPQAGSAPTPIARQGGTRTE
jgi:hypothetical protein